MDLKILALVFNFVLKNISMESYPRVSECGRITEYFVTYHGLVKDDYVRM